MTTSAEPETVKALYCESCDKVFSHDEAGPTLYECGTCGPFVSEDSHRCESCNKFASKSADESCPDCEGTVEETDAIVDPETEELHASVAALAQAIEDRKPKNVAKRAKEEAAAQERAAKHAEEHRAWRQQREDRRSVMLETIREAVNKSIPEGIDDDLSFVGIRTTVIDRDVYGETFQVLWDDLYLLSCAALQVEPDQALLDVNDRRKK